MREDADEDEDEDGDDSDGYNNKDEINRNEYEKCEKMQMKMNMKTTDQITTMLHLKIPHNPSQSLKIPHRTPMIEPPLPNLSHPLHTLGHT